MGILTKALTVALVAVMALCGLFAFLYARQASDLETALASNKLLSEALDNVVKQSKIDEATVNRFVTQVRDLNAAFDEQQQELSKLANDPETKTYLDTPVPGNVRRLFK